MSDIMNLNWVQFDDDNETVTLDPTRLPPVIRIIILHDGWVVCDLMGCPYKDNDPKLYEGVTGYLTLTRIDNSYQLDLLHDDGKTTPWRTMSLNQIKELLQHSSLVLERVETANPRLRQLMADDPRWDDYTIKLKNVPTPNLDEYTPRACYSRNKAA